MAALKEAVKTDDVERHPGQDAGAGSGFDEARRSDVQGAAGQARRRRRRRRRRGHKPDDNVVDAEFSEVDDDKKKGAA